MQIIPQEWIKIITGFTESEILNQQCDPIALQWPKVSAGTFYTRSIGQLRESIHDRKKDQPGTFTIYRTEDALVARDCFDTSALQLQMPGATFQVASNFNCQENATIHFSKEYLTRLMTDTTQGPSASAGAGMGAILRFKQNARTPINLLENTNIRVLNGKIIGPAKVDISDIKIGIHENVTANFNRANLNVIQFNPVGPKINQIFTSTIQLPPHAPSRAEIACSQQLLHAAYTGTFLGAASLNSHTLVLTCIGGGAFNNRPADIFDSIVSAYLQFGQFIPEIILPVYSTNVDILPLITKFKQNGVTLQIVTK